MLCRYGKTIAKRKIVEFILGVLLDNIYRGMFRMVALDIMSNAASVRFLLIAIAPRQVIVKTGFRTENVSWQ